MSRAVLLRGAGRVRIRPLPVAPAMSTALLGLLLWLAPAAPRADTYEAAADQLTAFEEAAEDKQLDLVTGLYRDVLPVLLLDRSATRFDFAKQRCLKAVARHPEVVEPLVRADLASGEPKRVRHALSTLGEAGWVEFFDDVVARLDAADESVAATAPYTLRDLHDPRAIPILLNRPGGLRKYVDLLHNLCHRRPAYPALTRSLSHADADLRWRAAYALLGTGDEVLPPHAARLADDPDPQVREAAVGLALNIWPRSHRVARLVGPVAEKLLGDPDRRVRLAAVASLAWRRDRRCGPALHALLQDRTLSDDARRVIDAARNLTDEALFQLVRSEDGRIVPGRQPQIYLSSEYEDEVAKFAEWVERHPPAKL